MPEHENATPLTPAQCRVAVLAWNAECQAFAGTLARFPMLSREAEGLPVHYAVAAVRLAVVLRVMLSNIEAVLEEDLLTLEDVEQVARELQGGEGGPDGT